MEDVHIDEVCKYCCEDVDYTFRLKQKFEKDLKQRKLLDLLKNVELPLLRVLMKMERHGIFLDQSQLQALGLVVSKEIKQIETDVYSLANEEFNLKSPKQLGHILFEKMDKFIYIFTINFKSNVICSQ